MFEENAIAFIDLLFCITIWPMVWRLWRAKSAEGHSLWTSVPFAIMFTALIPLFWPISPLIALAHIPATIAWSLVALGTWRFRKKKQPNWIEEYSW